ncbi:hypothetical protein ACEXQB_007720 [Herbiconiux sp. P18]|uniref:hypothetical protein n=1 Tax=Herbiconiux liangxiaofengii TaxID=3342795 RepID=UPI0035B981FE
MPGPNRVRKSLGRPIGPSPASRIVIRTRAPTLGACRMENTVLDVVYIVAILAVFGVVAFVAWGVGKL